MNQLRIALITLLAAALACGGTTVDELADAARTPTNAVAESSTATSPPEVKTESPPEATAQPTRTAAPTEVPPTATPRPEDVSIVASGFGQDGQEVAYAILVQNPNSSLALEDTQYQVAAFAADGTVLESDSGYLSVIWPGETVGLAGSVYVEDGQTVDHVEAQLSQGRPQAQEVVPAFEVKQLEYRRGDFSDSVTATITNPFERDLTDLRISVIAYAADGAIIGGGYTYANLLLSLATTGVDVLVTVDPKVEVDHVELYPAISGLTLIATVGEPPAGVQPLEMEKTGFGQDGSQVAYAFVINNANTGYALENSIYRATAYSADGGVLAVDGGYLSLVLPGERLGFASSMFADSEEPVDHVDVHLMSGDYTESETLPFFTSENVSFQPGQFSSQVTGQIISPYSKDITNLRVTAVGFNEAGDIIGGGLSYLDFVPANGKAAIDVSVTMSGTPVSVELFAALSGLSDIKD